MAVRTIKKILQRRHTEKGEPNHSLTEACVFSESRMRYVVFPFMLRRACKAFISLGREPGLHYITDCHRWLRNIGTRAFRAIGFSVFGQIGELAHR
jgi:hypothetical protein